MSDVAHCAEAAASNVAPAHVAGHRRVIVLLPLYEDWEALPELLERLDKALTTHGVLGEVIIADDGSPSAPDVATLTRRLDGAINSLTILRLSRNLGHQRAIAIGLSYINAERPDTRVVVMDADGEDDPEDVPRLLEAGDRPGAGIVFAARAERSEGLTFRTLYRLYRWSYRLLTGSPISFGNFGAVPAALLPRLVILSELWNHYPAAVLKARLPISTVPVRRARRLAGRSRMNLVSLILHGLGAISVHGDVVGVRALIATLVAILLGIIAIGGVLVIRFGTNLAIPGWATYAIGLLAAILLQTVSLALVFVFITLNSRDRSTFIPKRDYEAYIAARHQYP